MNKSTFAIILLILLVGTVAYDIFLRKTDISAPELFNEKPYRDSINSLARNIKTLQVKIDSLGSENQTLSEQKSKTKIIYVQKIKFISGASVFQCDSIIRNLSGF